jgi:hypothetical protein
VAAQNGAVSGSPGTAGQAGYAEISRFMSINNASKTTMIAKTFFLM